MNDGRSEPGMCVDSRGRRPGAAGLDPVAMDGGLATLIWLALPQDSNSDRSGEIRYAHWRGQTNIQSFGEFLAGLLALGGGLGVVVFGLAKWLCAKWLDDRLARGLEKLRLEQSKDLAQAKAKWDADLQGLLKYQEREFPAVGEAWRLLQLASDAAVRAASPFSLPFDLHYMGTHQLQQFLDATFSQDQAKNILKSENQATALESLFKLKLRAECEARLVELSGYINANFPFIPEALFEKLGKANLAMELILNTLKLEVVTGRSGAVASMEAAERDLHPQMAELRRDVKAYMADVRNRLGAKA